MPPGWRWPWVLAQPGAPIRYDRHVDPVTHALLGAAMAQTMFPASEGRRPLLLGAVGGMLADADVVLRPFSDPALPWEAHRHITHAMAFAPVGGLLTALPFLMWPWWRRRWKTTLAAGTLAYAGHGPLDACTSYGTHLLLPFSASSTAWDIIAIIDPLFTAILLAGVAATIWRARAAPAALALVMCAGYLVFGVRQHAAALDALTQTAATRGHTVVRARAMPTPGNLVVWRALYVADGRIYADGVHVPLLGPPRVRQGVSLELYRPDALAEFPAENPRNVRIADVVARFDRFTDGFLARDPRQPDVLGDMRYSLE
ncbi:MAG TPA: metal-dependent hydrolase, partial [Ktedonobacterales bacterium]|nr:metal-dependent hydrolase [Ktedonobacterales bacterium]